MSFSSACVTLRWASSTSFCTSLFGGTRVPQTSSARSAAKVATRRRCSFATGAYFFCLFTSFLHHFSVMCGISFALRGQVFVLNGCTFWQSQSPKVRILCCCCYSTWGHSLSLPSCDHGFHMFCLKPRLTEVPEGQWFCNTCKVIRLCLICSLPFFLLFLCICM